MAPPASSSSRRQGSSCVSFRDVEVIELPIVPGADHPTNSRRGDTAAITIGWKPQSRMTIDLDTYENSKEKEAAKSKKKNGSSSSLKRIFLPRAVRKRMLRKQGFETSDTEDEVDPNKQRRPLKKKKNKKKQKKNNKKTKTMGRPRIPGEKMLRQTLCSDRFSSSSSSSPLSSSPSSPQHHKTTTATTTMLSPTRKQSRFGEKRGFSSSDAPPALPFHAATGNNRNKNRSSGVVVSSDDDEDFNGPPRELLLDPPSPRSPLRSPTNSNNNKKGWKKRTKTALGSLAKQPVKLARSTRKRFNNNSSKHASSASSDDEAPFASNPIFNEDDVPLPFEYSCCYNDEEEEEKVEEELKDDSSSSPPLPSSNLLLSSDDDRALITADDYDGGDKTYFWSSDDNGDDIAGDGDSDDIYITTLNDTITYGLVGGNDSTSSWGDGRFYECPLASSNASATIAATAGGGGGGGLSSEDDYDDVAASANRSKQRRRSRRNSVTHVLGTMAKSPVTFARSTRNRLRKKKQQGEVPEEEMMKQTNDSSELLVLPPSTPPSQPRPLLSSDDEVAYLEADRNDKSMSFSSIDEYDEKYGPGTTYITTLNDSTSERKSFEGSFSLEGISSEDDENRRYNGRRQKRNNLTHVLGALAKQPVRVAKSTPKALGTLAKQPVKLARSTHKRLSKNRSRRKEKEERNMMPEGDDCMIMTSDDDIPLPSSAPTTDLSSDDDHFLFTSDDDDNILIRYSSSPPAAAVDFANENRSKPYNHYNVDNFHTLEAERSPLRRSRRERRGSLLGSLAKQPARLAKSTHKRLTRHIMKKKKVKKRYDDTTTSGSDDGIFNSSDDDIELDDEADYREATQVQIKDMPPVQPPNTCDTCDVPSSIEHYDAALQQQQPIEDMSIGEKNLAYYDVQSIDQELPMGHRGPIASSEQILGVPMEDDESSTTDLEVMPVNEVDPAPQKQLGHDSPLDKSVQNNLPYNRNEARWEEDASISAAAVSRGSSFLRSKSFTHTIGEARSPSFRRRANSLTGQNEIGPTINVTAHLEPLRLPPETQCIDEKLELANGFDSFSILSTASFSSASSCTSEVIELSDTDGHSKGSDNASKYSRSRRPSLRRPSSTRSFSSLPSREEGSRRLMLIRAESVKSFSSVQSREEDGSRCSRRSSKRRPASVKSRRSSLRRAASMKSLPPVPSRSDDAPRRSNLEHAASIASMKSRPPVANESEFASRRTNLKRAASMKFPPPVPRRMENFNRFNLQRTESMQSLPPVPSRQGRFNLSTSERAASMRTPQPVSSRESRFSRFNLERTASMQCLPQMPSRHEGFNRFNLERSESMKSLPPVPSRRENMDVSPIPSDSDNDGGADVSRTKAIFSEATSSLRSATKESRRLHSSVLRRSKSIAVAPSFPTRNLALVCVTNVTREDHMTPTDPSSTTGGMVSARHRILQPRTRNYETVLRPFAAKHNDEGNLSSPVHSLPKRPTRRISISDDDHDDGDDYNSAELAAKCPPSADALSLSLYSKANGSAFSAAPSLPRRSHDIVESIDAVASSISGDESATNSSPPLDGTDKSAESLCSDKSNNAFSPNKHAMYVDLPETLSTIYGSQAEDVKTSDHFIEDDGCGVVCDNKNNKNSPLRFSKRMSWTGTVVTQSSSSCFSSE